jgi:hypothetical protein
MPQRNDGQVASTRRLVAAAQAMAEAAARGRSVVRTLKAMCPHVYRQIVADGRQPARLACWGRSVNVDENTREVIVHPAILQGIGTLAGVPMAGRGVHAGLEHTYGYLFSLIDTPYGPKRDRWITPDLENAFGVEPSVWSESPKTGTLLGNLTYFLARVLADGEPRALSRCTDLARDVAPDLLHLDYSGLSRQRIVEHAVLTREPSREVFIFTDLLAFPQPPADPRANNTLLIYSVRTGRRSPTRFVTAFPVTADTVRATLATVPSTGKVPVRLRYNAYVPGLFGRTVLGRRCLAMPDGQN